MLAALEEGLRDRGRLLAFLALVLALALLALVLRLAFLGLVWRLAFLALVRVPVALLAARRRAGFSGVVSDAAAAFAASCAGPRPSPMLLANWDRCSE